MPANLNNPFGESCCDGGECNTRQSAQPCGCDPGCKPKPHICERHQMEAEIQRKMKELMNGTEGVCSK